MPSKSTYTKEYRHFLELLTSARQESGMSQKDVADALGRPQSYVSRYEAGQTRIDAVELVRLSLVIGFDAPAMLEAVKRQIAGKG